MLLHNLVCNFVYTLIVIFVFNNCKLKTFLTHLFRMNPQGKDSFH